MTKLIQGDGEPERRKRAYFLKHSIGEERSGTLWKGERKGGSEGGTLKGRKQRPEGETMKRRKA